MLQETRQDGLVLLCVRCGMPIKPQHRFSGRCLSARWYRGISYFDISTREDMPCIFLSLFLSSSLKAGNMSASVTAMSGQNSERRGVDSNPFTSPVCFICYFDMLLASKDLYISVSVKPTAGKCMMEEECIAQI